MTLAERETVDQPTKPARRRRRFVSLRFGLRTLFVFAILFCVFFAWIGRGLYRVRQEDAAIEAILQAGGKYRLAQVDDPRVPRKAPSDPKLSPWTERWADTFSRAAGWSERPRLDAVSIQTLQSDDPRADRALAAMPQFPEIEFVVLQGPACDDSAVDSLERLPRLQKLHLWGTGLTGAGLAKMAAPERIETLVIEQHPRQADILSCVPAFVELRELQVISLPVTKEHVAVIATLPKLEKLDLLETMSRQGTIAPLAGHAELRTLFVRAFAYDAADLQAIASLPRLESFHAYGLTDDDLATIGTSPSLKTVGLYDHVTRDAALQFSIDHPDWTVIAGSVMRPEYLQAGKPIPDPSARTPIPRRLHRVADP